MLVMQLQHKEVKTASACCIVEFALRRLVVWNCCHLVQSDGNGTGKD